MPKQQEAPRKGQGVRPPLQHGVGEREGDVDRDTEEGGWEEGKASE